MNQRSILVLASVAALLIAVVIWNQWSTASGSGDRVLLLPKLAAELDQVESVSVTKAGNETVVEARRVQPAWVIANKDDYPADVAKIREALQTLSQARVLEPKTSNAELYSHLGVEPVDTPSASGVALTLSVDGSPQTVILGRTEGQKYRYARLAEEAQSYLIDKDPKLPKAATEWVDPLIIDLDGARVHEVTVSREGETLHVAKASRSDANFAVDNVPSGRELLYASVADTMASAMHNLRLEDVAKAGPDDGMPQIVTELRTFDGLVVTVNALRLEDQDWLTFAASYDPELAAAFAQLTPAEPPTTAGSEAEAAAPPAASPPANDPQAEMEKLNARLSGWRYRVSTYQFGQLTRSMQDLLKAKP
jgi:Domain of unknown function (DUF4340)